MTNGSGPTQPPGPRPHVLSGVADQSARIVRLPDALSAVARAQRLEGQVIQQNPDGSTRVRTEQGDLDIIVRGRQPQQGQQIQVDVPSGRPPRQVVIRQAPQQPSQTSSPPQADDPVIQTRITAQTVRAEQAVQRVEAQQQSTATRTAQPAAQPAAANTSGRADAPTPQTSTPRPLPAQAPAQIPQQPTPLPAGTTVRFLPVTPAQAQQIVQQTIQNLTTLPTSIARAAFTANLIAQDAQTTNTQSLLSIRAGDVSALTQTVRTVPLPTAQNAAPVGSAIANVPPALQLVRNFLGFTPQSQPALTNTATPTTAPASVIYGKTGPVLTLTQAPLATGQIGVAKLIPALNSLITTLPGGSGLTNLPSSFARITQFDATLLNIRLPDVSLTPPTALNARPQGLPVPDGAFKITPPIATPTTPAGTLTAQVSGMTPQNLPLITLQWPGTALPQNFVLQFSASNLPLGAQITLSPGTIMVAQPGSAGTQAAASAGASASGGTINLPPGLLSLFGPGPWPTLDETYQTLYQAAPQAAQSLARILPSPANPSQLGSAALLFIAAVRSGDIASWLGDKKIDLLQRATGRGNILGRVTQDLSTIAQRTADSASATGDWKAIPLPMFWEGEVQKVALYVKDDGGRARDDDDKGDKQTRFIFDLDLTRMGGVQLDGLVRGKRFDLVLRTQTPLSVSMQQAMKQSYNRALHDTDLHGDLSFQGDIKSWVNVLQQDSQYGASA